MKKILSAFSLAEILITMGVIGVIMAMTLPNLISKYNEQVTIYRLKKTYSELQQVIKLSEADNGPLNTWTWDIFTKSQEFAEQYFLPYFKDVKLIGRPYDSYLMKMPDNSTINHVKSAKYLINGKPVLIETCSFICNAGSNVICSPTLQYVEIYVDINGKKGISMIGKDVFLFTLFNYTYKSPFGYSDGKHYGLYQGDIAGYYGAYRKPINALTCNKTQVANCGLMIEKNGWKIPDNYPIKF